MPKFKTAALLLPELLTVAEDPGDPIVTVPALTVAAVPFVPFVPFVPLDPVVPVAPFGMVKLSIAALAVPALVMVTEEPGDPVVTDPTDNVAANPLCASTAQFVPLPATSVAGLIF